MYYEINVAKLSEKDLLGSKHYDHFFATAERSITSDHHLKEVLRHFVILFPSPAFEISVFQYKLYRDEIDLKELVKSNQL